MNYKLKIGFVLVLCFSMLAMHGCGSVNTLEEEDGESVYVRPEKSMSISADKIYAYHRDMGTIIKIDGDACPKDTEISIEYNTFTQPVYVDFGTAVYSENEEMFVCTKSDEQALSVRISAREPGKRISSPVEKMID